MAGKFRFRWPSWWAVIWQISIIENLTKMKIPSQINPPLSFIGFYIILFINILDEHEGNIFFIKGQICLKVNFYQTILYSCSFEPNFDLPIHRPLWPIRLVPSSFYYTYIDKIWFREPQFSKIFWFTNLRLEKTKNVLYR